MQTGTSQFSESYHVSDVPVFVPPPVEPSQVAESEPNACGVSEDCSLMRDRGVSIKERALGLLDHDIQMLRQAPPPNLFPLILTPLDRFFCADDSAAFPMTSIIHLDFSGEVDHDAFAQSLSDALVRHPLLAAHIRIAKRGLPCWVPATDKEPQIDVGPLDKPLRLLGPEGFDLSNELGVRFWIRTSSQASRVTMQVHHACTDGTGVYRFLGDLWALYGARTATGEKVPVLGDVDLRLLRSRRRRITNLANQPDRGSALVCQGLREAMRIFGACVQPLAGPRDPSGGPQPPTEFPEIASLSFDKQQHEQMRAFAARHGAMLNDLLMAEMYRTIVRWNDRLGRLRSHRSIRIMMPSDLRSTEDYSMPATNMTAYTFLSQKPGKCRDMATLLQSIREQTGKIKHERLGTKFVDALALAEYAPPILNFMLARKWCMATTILSNVGDPSRRFTARFPRDGGRVVCGNLKLDRVTGVPPLRKQSHATVAIFTYLRKLTISVRCNPYLFDATHTREFLDMYADGLRGYLV